MSSECTGSQHEQTMASTHPTRQQACLGWYIILPVGRTTVILAVNEKVTENNKNPCTVAGLEQAGHSNGLCIQSAHRRGYAVEEVEGRGK